MGIRKNVFINNLSVGLIPIFVLFVLISIVLKKQNEVKLEQSLTGLIENFKIYQESELNKFRDYAKLLSQYQFYYGKLNDGQNQEIPVGNIKFRIFEYYLQDELTELIISSWDDNIYTTSTNKATYIWDYLNRPMNSTYFQFSFPEIVSNVLVMRNCAIISGENSFDKIGFSAVIMPMDYAFLSEMPFLDSHIDYFLETENGFVFSDNKYESSEINTLLTQIEWDENDKYKIADFGETGKYYYYKEILYKNPERISNELIVKDVVYIGVLYDFDFVNKQLFTSRRLLLIILILSVLIMTTVSYIFGSQLTNPIFELKKRVEQFENNLQPLPLPIKHKDDEIYQLEKSFCKMSENIYNKTNELVKTHAILEEEKNKLQIQNNIMNEELEVARKIQMAFIPEKSPKDNIAFYYKPMYQVGGDYFEFINFRNDNIGIFISDVSGHGVSAALITSMIKSFSVYYRKLLDNPAEYLNQLNESLTDLTAGNFITAFYGILNTKKRTFTFANAGHNHPYVINQNEVKEIKIEKSGFPLVVMTHDEMVEINKVYCNNTIKFSPGDKIFLFTDGLTEAVNIKDCGGIKDKNILDFEAKELSYVLRKYQNLKCDKYINQIQMKLSDFRGIDEFEDDVCMICIDIE